MDQPPTSTDTTATITTIALAFEGGIGVAAWALGYLVGAAPLATLHWDLSAGLWGLAASLPMFALLVLGTKYPIGPMRDLDRFMHSDVVPLFRQCTLLQLAAISTVAGVAEEMFFRGLVQHGLQRAIAGPAGPWIAVAVASLTFGLAHALTRTYAVLTGAISIYLGWLLLRSDNLLMPIVAHAAYDFAAFVYLLRPDNSVDPQRTA